MQLIFLHGRGAVGKLTVGQALQALTGLPLFHNHLVVDAVLSVFPFGSAEFARLRHDWWLGMFEAAARAGRSLIFTFAPESSVPASFVGEAQAVVERAGGCVRFVQLTCDEAERERRIEAPSRARWGKLNSLAKARTLPADASAYPPLPADLTVDTGALSPDAAAAKIADFLGLAPADH
jgi:chloramphenicol 3-O-phosphotransferase